MLGYLYNQEKKLVLKDLPEPVLMKGSAIIRVEAASICGTDIRTFKKGSSKITPPRVIGHEVIGKIMEIDASVKDFVIGNRIQIAPAIGCEECVPCRKGLTNLCDNLSTIGFQYDGAFSQYMQVPAAAFKAKNVNLVLSDLPPEKLVLAEPVACILNSHEYLKIHEGDTVVIFGAGFIGLMHAMIAQISGAKKIFMVEVDSRRLALAAEIVPGIIPMNSRETDIFKHIPAKNNGRGVDVAIVACSIGPVQKQAMLLSDKQARISLFGGLVGESTGFIDSNLIHYNEISVYGVHASTAAQNKKALGLIENGILDVEPFTKNQFPLQDIEKAFRSVVEENSTKPIIIP